MSQNYVLWVYVVLLVAGGLIGYLKAGSKISLISSLLFAIPLALSAAGKLPSWSGKICLAVLLVVFAIRLAKTKAFMPSGLMTLLTGLALLLLLIKR